MVEVGDIAPSITAPMARPENAAGRGEYTRDDVEEFVLEDTLVAGPVVLAFFPGAFTRTCTEEMCALRDWLTEIGTLEAQVYGVSADTPWSLLAFIREYDLNYPLLSGFNNSVIDDYHMRVTEGLMAGISRRSIFIISGDQRVVYRWEGETLGELPDIQEVANTISTL